VIAVREHRRRQLEEQLRAGSRSQDHGLVIRSTIGTPADGTAITRRFQRLLADATLPRQRFPDLRHACASLLLAQEIHPRVAMEILGHSQISLTMNSCTHVIPKLQRESANRMVTLLAGGSRLAR